MTTVDIAIPVYNEAEVLQDSVRELYLYLRHGFPFDFHVTVVDNASTDATWRIAEEMPGRWPGLSAMRLDEKGRGRALRAAWWASPYDVVAYMDVDLSTDLNALLPLVAPLVSGHSDVAIGTRWHRDARVTRGPKRKAISWAYNHLLHASLGVHFSDAMCGFKAMRADAARRLLPHVRDNAWFFDAELLILAERAGMRIHEVPLDWVDDPDSRVDVVTTAKANLAGIWRMRRHRAGDAVGAGRRGTAPPAAQAELPADRHLSPV